MWRVAAFLASAVVVGCAAAVPDSHWTKEYDRWSETHRFTWVNEGDMWRERVKRDGW